MYDSRHKIGEIDFDKTNRLKLRSDTFYESDLLCMQCDTGLLSKLEDYAKRIYQDGKTFRDFSQLAREGPSPGDLAMAFWPIDDYRTLKLFWLSIIWRMHISTLPFFKQVDLGNMHSENLRIAISNENYVPAEDYSVAVMVPEHIPNMLFRMITAPRRIRFKQNSYYVQLMNGLFVMINISPVDELPIIRGACLRDEGFMKIPILRGEIAEQFYDSILGGDYKIRMNKK